jgi:uncharacterized protein YfbU (UPF0304 family)
MQAKSERFELRLDQTVLDQLDAWRANEKDIPSRAESIRRLMEIGFDHRTKPLTTFSTAERLIMMMLNDLFKALKVKGEVDPEFIMSAIYGGHYWALDWQYQGLLHNERDDKADVSEVVDILDMWSFIESSYKKLGKIGQMKVKSSKHRFSQHVTFIGFDGNNETGHLRIARFLMEKMDRFTSFSGRELNSHCETLPSYRRMLQVFNPMRPTLVGKGLTSEQIVEIFKAA